jgi:hypothetical protein
MVYDHQSEQRDGHLYQLNRSNKGLRRPPLRELTGPAVLVQTPEPRALDWYALEQSVQPFRWSGPSPRPRVLIPFSGTCTARLTLNVLGGSDDVVDALSFDDDGVTLAHVVAASTSYGCRIELEMPLRRDEYSVLGITTPRMVRPADRAEGADSRLLGIALGDVELAVSR